MKNLRDTLYANQRLIEDHANFLFKESRGFFTSSDSSKQMQAAARAGNEIIACGKSIESLISSLELDLKLYHDTRDRVANEESSSLRITALPSSILASKSPAPLLHVDEKIVQSKAALLSKIEDYNRRITGYRSDFGIKWGKDPQFVSF